MSTEFSFEVVDYVVFCALFGSSLIVGLWVGWQQRKVNKARTHLASNRDIGVIPVSMSLVANFQSATFIVGVPATIYQFGMVYVCIALSYLPSVMFAAHVMIPRLYKANHVNTYEYLSAAYKSKTVGVVCSIFYIFLTMSYLSVVMFTPSMILQQMVGLPYWASLLVVTSLCNIYTTLGGIKGVIWTDAIQLGVTCVGYLTILAVGISQTGGIRNIVNIVKNETSLKKLNLDPSPLVQHSLFSYFIGGTFIGVSLNSSNQEMVQRYLCLRSENKAKLALYVHMVGNIIFLIMAILCGLVAVARYKKIDLVAGGIISNNNQLMAYMVGDISKNYPGVKGLFMAAIFSAAISSLSSGLNGITAVTHNHVISLFRMSGEREELKYARIICFAYGVVVTALSFLPVFSEATILQLGYAIFGMSGGPIMGLFTMALFFKFINKNEALFGFFCGVLTTVWIIVEFITLSSLTHSTGHGTITLISYLYFGAVTLCSTLLFSFLATGVRRIGRIGIIFQTSK